MEICRACLLSDQDMMALDDVCVINYNLLTNLKISLGDEMPQYFCQNCFNLMKVLIEFRERAILSDATLRDISENTKPNLCVDNLPIESNIKTEKDDDSDKIDYKDNDSFHSDEVPGVTYNKKSSRKANVLKAPIDKSSLQCVLCTKKFEDCTMLLKHLKEHKRGAKCKLCFKKVLLADLHMHTLSHIADMKPPRNILDEQKVKLEFPDECESNGYLDTYATEFDDSSSVYQNAFEDKKKKMDARTVKKNEKETKVLNEYKEKYLCHCGICKMKFDSKELLVKHLESHKSEGTSCCKLCQECFGAWPQLFAHRFVHLPRAQQRCHLCAKRCFSEAHMEFHYRLAHYDGEDKYLKCKHCLRPFETPRKLSKHMRYTHGETRFICDYCKKSFINKSRLRIHIVCHGGPKRFVCDLCGFSCRLSNGLRAHKIRHASNRIKCTNCDQMFLDQAKADKHILKCKARVVICPECGKEIKMKSYNAHVRQHQSAPSYACPRCPARFRGRGSLKVHLDQHDGNRTQHCDFCSASFYSPSVLIKHRRVHTGEKPYVCKVCHKGFTGNHNLKVHMRTHGEDLIVKREQPQQDNTQFLSASSFAAKLPIV